MKSLGVAEQLRTFFPELGGEVDGEPAPTGFSGVDIVRNVADFALPVVSYSSHKRRTRWYCYATL